MTCREVQSDLALLVGGDLNDRARLRELREHVAGCAACREHHHALKSSLKALAGVGPATWATTWERPVSLWPEIRREISQPPVPSWPVQIGIRLKAYAPFAAMAAALLLMLAGLVQLGSPSSDLRTDRQVPAGPPVALQTTGEAESESPPPESPGMHPPPADDAL